MSMYLFASRISNIDNSSSPAIVTRGGDIINNNDDNRDDESLLVEEENLLVDEDDESLLVEEDSLVEEENLLVEEDLSVEEEDPQLLVEEEEQLLVEEGDVSNEDQFSIKEDLLVDLQENVGKEDQLLVEEESVNEEDLLVEENSIDEIIKEGNANLVIAQPRYDSSSIHQTAGALSTKSDLKTAAVETNSLSIGLENTQSNLESAVLQNIIDSYKKKGNITTSSTSNVDSEEDFFDPLASMKITPLVEEALAAENSLSTTEIENNNATNSSLRLSLELMVRRGTIKKVIGRRWRLVFWLIYSQSSSILSSPTISNKGKLGIKFGFSSSISDPISKINPTTTTIVIKHIVPGLWGDKVGLSVGDELRKVNERNIDVVRDTDFYGVTVTNPKDGQLTKVRNKLFLKFLNECLVSDLQDECWGDNNRIKDTNSYLQEDGVKNRINDTNSYLENDGATWGGEKYVAILEEDEEETDDSYFLGAYNCKKRKKQKMTKDKDSNYGLKFNATKYLKLEFALRTSVEEVEEAIIKANEVEEVEKNKEDILYHQMQPTGEIGLRLEEIVSETKRCNQLCTKDLSTSPRRNPLNSLPSTRDDEVQVNKGDKKLLSKFKMDLLNEGIVDFTDPDIDMVEVMEEQYMEVLKNPDKKNFDEIAMKKALIKYHDQTIENADAEFVEKIDNIRRHKQGGKGNHIDNIVSLKDTCFGGSETTSRKRSYNTSNSSNSMGKKVGGESDGNNLGGGEDILMEADGESFSGHRSSSIGKVTERDDNNLVVRRAGGGENTQVEAEGEDTLLMEFAIGITQPEDDEEKVPPDKDGKNISVKEDKKLVVTSSESNLTELEATEKFTEFFVENTIVEADSSSSRTDEVEKSSIFKSEDRRADRRREKKKEDLVKNTGPDKYLDKYLTKAKLKSFLKQEQAKYAAKQDKYIQELNRLKIPDNKKNDKALITSPKPGGKQKNDIILASQLQKCVIKAATDDVDEMEKLRQKEIERLRNEVGNVIDRKELGEDNYGENKSEDPVTSNVVEQFDKNQLLLLCHTDDTVTDATSKNSEDNINITLDVDQLTYAQNIYKENKSLKMEKKNLNTTSLIDKDLVRVKFGKMFEDVQFEKYQHDGEIDKDFEFLNADLAPSTSDDEIKEAFAKGRDNYNQNNNKYLVDKDIDYCNLLTQNGYKYPISPGRFKANFLDPAQNEVSLFSIMQRLENERSKKVDEEKPPHYYRLNDVFESVPPPWWMCKDYDKFQAYLENEKLKQVLDFVTVVVPTSSDSDSSSTSCSTHFYDTATLQADYLPDKRNDLNDVDLKNITDDKLSVASTVFSSQDEGKEPEEGIITTSRTEAAKTRGDKKQEDLLIRIESVSRNIDLLVGEDDGRRSLSEEEKDKISLNMIEHGTILPLEDDDDEKELLLLDNLSTKTKDHSIQRPIDTDMSRKSYNFLSFPEIGNSSFKRKKQKSAKKT